MQESIMKSNAKKPAQQRASRLVSAKTAKRKDGAKVEIKGSDDYKLGRKGLKTLTSTGSDDYKL
jgi:hypothetical protein